MELAARTLLVAAGTTPNITYAKEFPDALPLDARRRFFAPHKAVPEAGGFRLEPAAADDETAFFTGFSRGGKFVTFFGDNHPAYNGNVVKAMASAKNGYQAIAEVLNGRWLAGGAPTSEWDAFRAPARGRPERAGRRRQPAHADDRRGRRARTRRRAQLPARPVLPPPEPGVARARGSAALPS